MQILKMTCPNCGANLTYEDGQNNIICVYCDSHVLVHNENEHTVHIVDDAEMARLQMEREQAEKQRSADLKKKSAKKY